MPDRSPTLRLTLVPVGEGPPLAIRAKQLLKYALRACKLRCVDIVQVPAPPEPDPADDAAYPGPD